MKWFENFKEAWNRFLDKEATQKFLQFCRNTGSVIGLAGKWGYKLRSLVLAIPVFICACALAIRNLRQLPETVGINMLADGQYQWMVSRGAAVTAPLFLTVVCILLMFCSKKVLYPWLISVFSLVLPLVIWISNLFSV